MMSVSANWTCDGNLSRPSCQLSTVEYGELDSVAAIRIVVSCLSLIGALSIIVSTAWKREVLNHKVHPIFVLSVADALLSMLYIVGGCLWFRDEKDLQMRVWCFAVTLPTVILQCVTVNLTVLYALLAYAGVRQKHIGNLLRDIEDEEQVWSRLKTVVAYLVAWLVPVVVVMLLFTAVVIDTNLLDSVNQCSCWCKPSLGNLIPYAKARDDETMQFRKKIRRLIVIIAGVYAGHFLIGFIILVAVYRVMIRAIRSMRETARRQTTGGQYGAVGHMIEPVLQRAETQAKKRAVYFLLVFIITGFFNLILCVELIILDVRRFIIGERMSPSLTEPQTPLHKLHYITLCLQSVTITQQGFLNAIVYGWTRGDFLHVMRQRNKCGDSSTQLVSDIGSSGSEDEQEGDEEIDGETPRRRRKRKRENEVSREQSFEYSSSDYEELETSAHQQ